MLGDLSVSYDIWDLARFHRMSRSGTLSEPIIAEFTDPLPCLAAPTTDENFSIFLAILSGPELARLYGQYGTRLLELNVRSFLQAKGAVNRGIRDTLLAEPERFLAYNNGITATASHVEFTPLRDGGRAIRRVHDLQIVNGGQTTASIHYSYVKDKADISGVFVQMKLTVIDDRQRLQEIVPEISKYSNTQNKVTLVDFSSNHPYHVAVEKVTRSLWAPAADGSGQDTRWFYERARGQYADALARERTPARQRAFKTIHPLSQKFTKSDVAKFEHSWAQLPHIVSLGAEKNFREFMIKLADKAPAVEHRLLPAADRQSDPFPLHGKDHHRSRHPGFPREHRHLHHREARARHRPADRPRPNLARAETRSRPGICHRRPEPPSAPRHHKSHPSVQRDRVG